MPVVLALARTASLKLEAVLLRKESRADSLGIAECFKPMRSSPSNRTSRRLRSIANEVTVHLRIIDKMKRLKVLEVLIALASILFIGHDC